MTAAFKKSNLKKAQKILVKEEKLCYDIRVVGMNMSEAGLSEWQTRWTQNPLMATSCGFKSRGRHSLAGAPEGLLVIGFGVFRRPAHSLAGAKPLNPKRLGFSGFFFCGLSSVDSPGVFRVPKIKGETAINHPLLL